MNFNNFNKLMQKHETCIKWRKETQFCEKHRNKIKCKEVASYHKTLKEHFEEWKKQFPIVVKLNLAQGRHTTTPWISFQGWEKNGIYPCIIFSENKQPYLTLQVEKRNPLSLKTGEFLSEKIIRAAKEWAVNKLRKKWAVNEVKRNLIWRKLICQMPENKYTISDILSFKLEDEKQIRSFLNDINTFFEENETSSRAKKNKNSIVWKIMEIEILTSNEDLGVVFFTSDKNAKFNDVLQKVLEVEYKIIKIIPFTKTNGMIMPLPIYKIETLPEIDNKTNKKVFKAIIDSIYSLDVLNTIQTYKEDLNIEIANSSYKKTPDEINFFLLNLEKNKVRSVNKRMQTQRKHAPFIRDRKLREMSLWLSEGFCQHCEKYAPFLTKAKKPYLESHHITPLSKNGEDLLENLIALCPNCHRSMHYSDNDINKALHKELENKTKTLIKKWKTK